MRNWRQAPICRTLLLVLAVTLIAVTLAYQFDTVHRVDVGDWYDRVYLEDFHERETAPDGESYRWSSSSVTVRFPGVGAGGRWLSLQMLGWRPVGHPLTEVRVLANDHFLTTLVVGPQWQEYRIWVPPQAAGRGTLEIVLETDPFVPAEAGAGGDPRALGVAVSQVALIPLGEAGILRPPAWDQLAWALLLALSLYLGLAVVGLPRRWSALVASLVILALSWCLALYRLRTTIYTHRLAIVALLGLLLLPALHWLFRRIFAWGQLSLGERELRILLAIFLLGFLLKAGGLLYPYSVAIDLKWHLEKSTWILDGRLEQLYKPGAFSKSVMPPEWGDDKPVIPYSPFYHLTAVSFFAFPWSPYATANVLSVLLDTTKPFLIYFLARRLGLGRRVGLLAGLFYAVIPATFLLHSWGNMPTQTGMWWTLASTCYIVGAWERLRQPRTWAGLTLFLLGTMLYYTVMAAFMGVFVGIFLLGLWLNGRKSQLGSTEKTHHRDTEDTETFKNTLENSPWSLCLSGYFSRPKLELRPQFKPLPLLAILLALVVAVGLSTAIYYGQYIRPIVEVTIPHFVESAGQGGANLGTVPVPWSVYARQHLVRMSGMRYGLIWPLLLAGAGLIIGRRHLRNPLFRWLLIAWFGTSLVFFLLGFRLDMVDKELFYAMPALSLCAALALRWLWQRGNSGRALVVVLYVFQFAAAMHTWIHRLSTVQQEWLNSDARILGERLLHLVALAGQ